MFTAGARSVDYGNPRRMNNGLAVQDVHAAAARDEPLTLLIVDDDPAVREALGMLALSYGWSWCAYASGAEFLSAGPPEDSAHSCLILDLNMPQLDGEDVLRLLRARGSRLPVVVITAENQEVRHQRALKAGAAQVLAKPFGDADFERAVRDCVQKQH